MSDSLQDNVKSSLAKIQDPETGRALAKQVHEIAIDGSNISVTVGLTSFALPIKEEFHAEVQKHLEQEFPDATVQVEISEHIRPAAPIGQVGLRAKAVIAVAAGKGGVGKSTAAVSLAIGLKRAGCAVGLLDADVYGPSLPHLTGVRGQVTKVDNKIIPLESEGVPLMSIGFMVPPGEAVIWRGPMLHSAITTFVRDTDWGELDYLIIDMPPGTGDIALSLSQLLPLTGAVIVCTPQEVALIDAIKAVGMFRKVKIPVLGVIENMSSFLCPDNGKSYDIFGKGGAREYASQDGIAFLGEIPINIQLRERGDAGEMSKNFEDPQIAPYLEAIARELVRTVSDSAKSNPQTTQLPVLG